MRHFGNQSGLLQIMCAGSLANINVAFWKEAAQERLNGSHQTKNVKRSGATMQRASVALLLRQLTITAQIWKGRLLIAMAKNCYRYQSLSASEDTWGNLWYHMPNAVLLNFEPVLS